MFNDKELKQIESIAKSSTTSKNVFDFLSKRQRFRRDTNLNKFHQILMNEGCSVVENDFIETFKMLEAQGVGSLIIGRKGKPNRFKWNYNLKGVAMAAKGQLPSQSDLSMEKVEKVQANEAKRGPGRPFGAKNKTRPTQIILNITPEFQEQLLELLKKAV